MDSKSQVLTGVEHEVNVEHAIFKRGSMPLLPGAFACVQHLLPDVSERWVAGWVPAHVGLRVGSIVVHP